MIDFHRIKFTSLLGIGFDPFRFVKFSVESISKTCLIYYIKQSQLCGKETFYLTLSCQVENVEPFSFVLYI